MGGKEHFRSYRHELNWRHYFALWIWIGWTFFYAFLPILLAVIAYFVSYKVVLYIVGGMLVTLLLPIEEKLQFKVR